MTPIVSLTPRETQIYGLIVEQAMPQNVIGQQIGCEHDTVKKHLQHIFDKTGASSVLELAVWHHTRSRALSEDKRQ